MKKNTIEIPKSYDVYGSIIIDGDNVNNQIQFFWEGKEISASQLMSIAIELKKENERLKLSNQNEFNKRKT